VVAVDADASNGEQLVTHVLGDGSYQPFGTLGGALRAEVSTAEGAARPSW
jgi:hypothetical protein